MTDTGGSPAFSWRIRVYWEDTDAGGVVYHAAYLRFMERARSEWLRARGVEQRALTEQGGIAFMVRDIQVHFHAPARLDEELEVRVVVEKVRAASVILAQTVHRPEDDATLIRAQVRIACVGIEAMRPLPIPEPVLARIF